MTATTSLAWPPAPGDDPRAAGPRRLVLRLAPVADPAFTVAVMVTDPVQFAAMRAGFVAKGFGEDCEWLVLDNSAGNRADAYVALNEFLQAATAPQVVICHQDVRLLDDGRAQLEAVLAGLEAHDPRWAIAGNAGMTAEGWPVTCLSDPHDALQVFGGPLPARVVSLDENFLVVRRAANLGLSHDLAGFHHYGAELCVQAALRGWSAWVVDFFLRHESAGSTDAAYAASAEAFAARYRTLPDARDLPLITGWRIRLGRRQRLAGLRQWLAKLLGRAPRNRDLWSERRRSAGERHRRALGRECE